ncbi:AsnC family transcriptional regulator [Paracoccus halophilus]|nr:GntR family transcriptional regulator [Paracoccus halophilus]KGJ06255.1 AsnC family transcriptional regulator [Paracoccus halophilus]
MSQLGKPTVQMIRDTLENAIVDGKLLPGERLDPEALAAEFGCSRTPIREALQSLESSGLVQVQPKRGTFVTKLGVPELAERFEVMAELEAMCARLAARRASTPEIETIQNAQKACARAVETGDSDAYYYENIAFHHAIYAASRNAFLEAEALRLQAMLQPYRRRQLQFRGRMMRSLDEHQRVVDLIAAGDAEGAASEMRNHVVIQGDRFHDLVASMRAAER